MSGTTVISGLFGNGTFNACRKRVHICGYACCKFGNLGNWIAAAPGELASAKVQRLSLDHLTIIEERPDGSANIQCNRPCVEAEFKPIDCAIYPLFPANVECTRFIVADHRKCPIPNRELIGWAFNVQSILRHWENEHPGSIARIVNDGKGFKAYQPYPFELVNPPFVRSLTEAESYEIRPNDTLPDNWVPQWTTGAPTSGYTSTSTPED